MLPTGLRSELFLALQIRLWYPSGVPTPGKVDGKRHKNLAQSCRPEKKKSD